MTVDTPPEAQPPSSTEQTAEQAGIVIAHFGARLLVETADQQRRDCHSRKSAGALVTGDRVVVETGGRDNVILRRLPRDSELSRPDSRGKQKTIAANIDQMLIVIAPRPAFKEGLIDRYLVAAELSRITPIIVLNKIDLLSADELQEQTERLAAYRHIGYQVITASAKQTHGLEPLHELVRGHTNIFVGQSGVGKSSLLNSLLPQADARVGDVSEATNKGTHTTTTAVLYHLPDRNGNIIDSPGVREFGLWQIRPEDVAQGFHEFGDYRAQCKFRDCLHRSEPGCAVREAVTRSAITRQRYDSYLKLLESVEQETY